MGLVLLERPGEVATDREAVAGQADRRFEHFCSRPPAEPSMGLEKSRNDGRRRDAKPAAHYWLETARPAKLRKVEACGHPSVELDCERLVVGRRVDEEPPITADAAVRWINDAERKSRSDYGIDRRASRDEQVPAGVGRELLRRNQQPAGATCLVLCSQRVVQLEERNRAKVAGPPACERSRRFVAIRSIFCYSCTVARTIPQRELRNDNARVIEAVAAGESFVVTRNGVPVAELRPIQRIHRSFVPKAELMALAAAGSHVDREQFRADLDRMIEQRL